jgi:hypothetical protein
MGNPSKPALSKAGKTLSYPSASRARSPKPEASWARAERRPGVRPSHEPGADARALSSRLLRILLVGE